MQGKVALITGASKGIGRATALLLAQEGALVAAVARSADLLMGLMQEAKDLPGKLLALPADITKTEQVEWAVQETLEKFGQIDILINNAGVERVKPMEDVTDEDFAATLDTNVKGVFLLTRAVVPAMKARRFGVIINIASTAGQRGFAEDTVYCASKFGVVGFSDALNEELRPFGIRVCCISPGTVNTGLAFDSYSPPSDPYRPHYLQPEDLAEVIRFVAIQPKNVAIESIVMRPTVKPPYSPPLPLEEQ